MLHPAQPSLDTFRIPLSQRRPTSFRRNQLKNLARRKGYRIQRVYQAHIGWTYVISILPYPGAGERVMRQYEYCKTQFATAAERAYMHLSSKPDISFRRKKKVSE
jgi:peptidoglycan/xylan/chitin deacetylase (PgdA/CDA1 family)